MFSQTVWSKDALFERGPTERPALLLQTRNSEWTKFLFICCLLFLLRQFQLFVQYEGSILLQFYCFVTYIHRRPANPPSDLAPVHDHKYDKIRRSTMVRFAWLNEVDFLQQPSGFIDLISIEVPVWKILFFWRHSMKS